MSDQPATAKFLTGDPLRHIVVMTISASVGLLSIFLVDFADLYFISLLGVQEMAAAVGFAGTILFFTTAISIGLSIAMAALAARRIGAGDPDEARRIASSVLTVGVLIALVAAAALWLATPTLLTWIGAQGETHALAASYLRIIIPSMPLMIVGMGCSGLLRAHGDARRAMNVTLAAGLTNAALDPLFIFGFGWGLEGAAAASVCARAALCISAVLPILSRYGGFAPLRFDAFMVDVRPILAVAAPAILTNVATPVGNFFVTRSMAPFGDEAMAGFSVVGRLTPLAFCLIFALSGAVGPIIGQNFGARNFARVRETLIKALLFCAAYVGVMWLLLAASHGWLAATFNLTHEGAPLLRVFALAVAPLFFFTGAVYVANAAFNNLNRPLWSSWLNWGKNTLGVLPFVWVGAMLGGAPGVLIGQAIGSVLFGVVAIWGALRLIDRYAQGRLEEGEARPPVMRPRPTPPFSSPRG